MTALIVVELPAADLRVDVAEVLDGIRGALHALQGRFPDGAAVAVDIVIGPKADAMLAILRPSPPLANGAEHSEQEGTS